MKIISYGTRGSIPIANPNSVRFGGNTTSIRIESDCLPDSTALILDGGSGLVPLSGKLLQEGIKNIILLLTHYHHDHTQGILLSPLTFIKTIGILLCGPIEGRIGPKEMMQDMMRPPYFPVHFKEVGSHFNFKGFEFPRTIVILIHPKGGYNFLRLDEYERLMKENKNLPIGKGKYALDECMVITMYKSRHPEQTITYRFEERPTGKVFVMLTDHENEDGLPAGLKRHLEGADLLIMDAQYTRDRYNASTAGFGHGTPDYCVKVAEMVGAKKLGLTHHDPTSTDKNIDNIVEEAIAGKTKEDLHVFACADYQEVIL